MDASNLRLFAPTTVAVDFSTEDIGGAMSATMLTALLGEILFRMPSHEWESGSGDRVQYGKAFMKNTHGSTDFGNAVMWIANALDDWGAGQDTITFQSDSADDDSGIFFRAIGYDVNGDPVQLDTAGNGVTEAASSDQLTHISRVTVHEDNAGEGYPVTPTAGNVTIRRGNGTVLGVIPAGYWSATGEVKIALAGALNDTLTITNAGDPDDDLSGFTFEKPRTYADGIALANSGVLTAGAGQGFWLEETVKEGMKPSRDVQIVLAIDGEAV